LVSAAVGPLPFYLKEVQVSNIETVHIARIEVKKVGKTSGVFMWMAADPTTADGEDFKPTELDLSGGFGMTTPPDDYTMPQHIGRGLSSVFTLVGVFLEGKGVSSNLPRNETHKIVAMLETALSFMDIPREDLHKRIDSIMERVEKTTQLEEDLDKLKHIWEPVIAGGIETVDVRLEEQMNILLCSINHLDGGILGEALINEMIRAHRDSFLVGYLMGQGKWQSPNAEGYIGLGEIPDAFKEAFKNWQ
jgi:hypothetical protein